MQNKKEDLYKVLGVEKTATASEINKAYRALAKRYHPDMHTNKSEAEKKRAEEKFKEVGNAYEVLSDKDKRAFYDATGCTDQNSMGGGFSGFNNAGGGFGGINLNDLFGNGGFSFTAEESSGGFGRSSFFSGSGGGFESFFGGGRPQEPSGRKSRSAPPPNQVFEYQLKVTLEEICTGVTKKIKVNKQLRNGETVPNIIEVKVLPGYKPGTKITFANAGNDHPDGSSTNVVVVLKEIPHALYKLSGTDIVYEFAIGLKESLRPFSKTIMGLRGTPIKITNETFGAVWGDRIVKDEGIPDRTLGGRRGNLIIKPRVMLDLTPKEIAKVKEALC